MVFPVKKSGYHLPKIAYCPVRVRLTDDFLHAIHHLTQLNSQQSQAIIDGDPDYARFDLLIHMASEAKEEAKYALMSHTQVHNCDEGADIVALTHAEKERVNDSRLKIESVSKSLKQVNSKEIPGFEAIEECLDDAGKSLDAALNANPKKPE
jgi:hypothetical protein